MEEFCMEHKENPGRLAYINEINDQLTRLVLWVESANKSNRTDLAVVSEDIVGGLLNLIFRQEGWKLINANTPNSPNFPGIDLADEELCIGVQVTANNSLDKVKDMLNKFYGHKLEQRFDRLILVELTTQDPSPGMKKRCTEHFDGNRDIWNIPYLMRLIQSIQDIDHLEEITVFLQKQVGDLHRSLQLPPKETPVSEEPEEIPVQLEQPEAPSPSLMERIASWFTDDEEEAAHSSTWSDLGKATIFCTVLLAALGLIFSFFPLSEMPPELSSYDVTINGASISVPTTFDALEALGWVPSDPEKMEEWVAPGAGVEDWAGIEVLTFRTNLTNAHGSITVQYMNPTAHTLPVKDCVIFYLNITQTFFDDSYTGESVNTLDTPLGLKMGISKWSDRTEFPSGCDKQKNASHISYRYVPKNSSSAYIFHFDRSTKLLNGVEIRYMDTTAVAKLLGAGYDYEAPVYNTENLYSWLGVTMNLHVDGFDYPILTTVRDYIALNYTVDKATEYVTSTKHSDIYFRGDALHTASCKVYNPFHRALTPENCFISCLDSRAIEPHNKPFIFTCTTTNNTLTILKGMTREELIEALNAAQIQWVESGLSSITFYPNPRIDTLYADCHLDFENLVTDITVDACNAVQNYIFNQVS